MPTFTYDEIRAALHGKGEALQTLIEALYLEAEAAAITIPNEGEPLYYPQPDPQMIVRPASETRVSSLILIDLTWDEAMQPLRSGGELILALTFARIGLQHWRPGFLHMLDAMTGVSPNLLSLIKGADTPLRAGATALNIALQGAHSALTHRQWEALCARLTLQCLLVMQRLNHEP